MGGHPENKSKMKSFMKDKVTVQGLITPVPAVLGGEQAGSRPSSSNDRNATTVMSLAEVADIATSDRNDVKDTLNPFGASGRVKRTPPEVGMNAKAGSRATPKDDLFQTPRAEAVVAETTIGNCSQLSKSSPNQEFIIKMRKEEVSAVAKMKTVIVKMKAALARQKNVSMDIREGVQEIEELICIAETSRSTWVKVEREAQVDALKNRKNAIEGTPLTSMAKRTAESPLEQKEGTEKRRNIEGEKVEEWKTVTYKRKPKPSQDANKEKPQKVKEKKKETKKLPYKSKPEALILKPAEGQSYANVLKTLRENEKSGTNLKVKTIRKTKTGSMLLELERGERINQEILSKMKDVVKDSAEIRSSTRRITLNIRDLDALTTAEEVAEAIRKVNIMANSDMKVRLSKPNSRELVQAFVTMSPKEAEELLTVGTIKIGWCRVKVKPHTARRKCFKCFGADHEQWDCTGPDRRGQGLCIRCGNAGHMMRDCNRTPRCCLCVEAGLESFDHLPASGKCRTVRTQQK